MATRGTRFAVGHPARCDEEGRAFPSDRYAQFVAVELVCKRCQAAGRHIVLGSWAVYSHFPDFRPDEVWERGPSKAMTREIVPEGTTTWTRFRFLCPKCRAAPQFREETVDRALAAVYSPGARILYSVPV